MKSDAIILGIESSCDETAAAMLRADGSILAEAVFSQLKEHAAFGGVVPEIAARAHLQHLPGLVAGVMAKAGIGYTDLGAVAATTGPGLIGGLIVGAPRLMMRWGRPLTRRRSCSACLGQVGRIWNAWPPGGIRVR